MNTLLPGAWNFSLYVRSVVSEPYKSMNITSAYIKFSHVYLFILEMYGIIPAFNYAESRAGDTKEKLVKSWNERVRKESREIRALGVKESEVSEISADTKDRMAPTRTANELGTAVLNISPRSIQTL